jgi:hypothetical protein
MTTDDEQMRDARVDQENEAHLTEPDRAAPEPDPQPGAVRPTDDTALRRLPDATAPGAERPATSDLPELDAARSQATELAERQAEALLMLQQQVIEFATENLRLHRRSLAALDSLTDDVRRMKRRLNRMNTARA